MGASFRPSDDENPDDGVVAEINITPLTDVFLVLLIIFMVTTSVVANQSKQVDLPGAEVSDTTPQGVTVTVNPDGSMLVNDQPTSEAELYAQEFRRRSQTTPPPISSSSGTRSPTPYRVVSVFCSGSGNCTVERIFGRRVISDSRSAAQWTAFITRSRL